MAPVRGSRAVSPENDLQLVVDVSPPTDRENMPRHGKMWWVVTGIMAVFVLVIIGGGILASCSPQYDYPPEPSTWDGSSVAIVLPTEEPEPNFPLTFADASRILKEQGLELQPEYSMDGYQVFTGPGIEVGITSFEAEEDLDEIEFHLERYRMETAARTFNELVWRMGLEKLAQRARRMVDWNLNFGSTARSKIDGISMWVYMPTEDSSRVLIRFWR